MSNRFGEFKKGKRKYLVVIGCVLLFLCPAIPTFGETADFLKMPSEKVDWAPSSMLMDGVKVDNRIVVVGEWGHILYSDNECDGWIQAEVPVSVTLTAVTFPTIDRGWAVGHDGVVLHTEDGGETWKKQLDGTQIFDLVSNQVKQVLDAKKALLADPETGIAEEEREDMEVEAQIIANLLNDVIFFMEQGPCQPLMDVMFKNDKEGIIIGVYGIILSTKDGGKTWQPILDRINNMEGLCYYAITRSGDDLFIAGEAGILYRSENFGQSWQRLESPYEGTFFGIIGDPSGGLVAAFGMKGNIFYSKNRGETWTPSKTNQEVPLFGGAFLSDGSLCVVGRDGVILKSMDRIKTFTALPVRYHGQGMAIFEVKNDVLGVAGTRGVSRLEINNPGGEK